MTNKHIKYVCSGMEIAGGDARRYITCAVMHGDILYMLTECTKIRSGDIFFMNRRVSCLVVV